MYVSLNLNQLLVNEYDYVVYWNLQMMFIDKSVKFPRWIYENISKSLVNCCTSVSYLIDNRLNDNNIFNDILFENVNLIENNVGVEH